MLGMLAGAVVAQGATLTVGPGQMFATISDAVSAATRGDTIEIQPGTYVEDVRVNKRLDLVGIGGSAQVIVRSGGGAQVFRVTGSRVTFTGIGVDAQGAMGFQARTSTVVALEFTDVHVFGARNANGAVGGAIDAFDANVTVTDSLFEDNVGERGGAISATDDLVVRSSTFLRNEAREAGGAISGASFFGSRFEITDSHFEGNEARGQAFPGTGGAIELFTEGGSQTDTRIDGNTFCGNLADDGGAIFIEGLVDPFATTQLQIAGNRFVSNVATDDGGALFVQGLASYYPNGNPLVVHLLQNTMLANDAAQGAAIFVGDDVRPKLNNDLIAFSTGGAALRQTNGQGVHQYSLFFDNLAGDLGGGIGVGDLGPGNVFGQDPLLAAFSDDGDCANDDTSLLPGSPAIDAGNPLFNDPDGTRSDIGAAP